MFKNNRVEADSVADFLERYYKKALYHGRGAEYAAGLLASHEKDFELYGYDIISHHDSVTGEVVAYFAAPTCPIEAPSCDDCNAALLEACEAALSYLEAEADHVGLGEYEEVTLKLIVAIASAR